MKTLRHALVTQHKNALRAIEDALMEVKPLQPQREWYKNEGNFIADSARHEERVSTLEKLRDEYQVLLTKLQYRIYRKERAS